MPLSSVVIVGAGHAGTQVAASLRQGGFDGTITLLSDEAELPYQRPPLSKEYLLGTLDERRLAHRPQKWYEDQNVSLLHEAVVDIDAKAHTVTTAHGTALGYDHLVLATGARNRELPVPGAALAGVSGMRYKSDADAIGSWLHEGTRVVVVGAGFIGLEFASVAAAKGASVHVIEIADRPMGRAVSAPTAEFFRATHEAWGVTFDFGLGLTSIDGGGDASASDGTGDGRGAEGAGKGRGSAGGTDSGGDNDCDGGGAGGTRDTDGGSGRALGSGDGNSSGRVCQVTATDGHTFAADAVVYGIGVVPNTELAQRSGLAVDNGILVDGCLLSSNPDISAIGDVACFPCVQAGGIVTRLESVQNAADQGRYLAARLLGAAGDYRPVPWFWSHQGDLNLQIAGLSRGHDEEVNLTAVGPREKVVLCFKEGTLIAVETVNRAADHMAARQLLEAGTELTPTAAAANGFVLAEWEKLHASRTGTTAS